MAVQAGPIENETVTVESTKQPLGCPQSGDLPLIELRSVGVSFPMSFDLAASARSKVLITARRWLRGNFSRRRIRHFEALKEVSFTASKGEIIGVLGPNGCGKTTLLRTISGIYTPDKGSVITRASMSTLLSVGTGFNNGLPGRANIYMAGHLMGLSKAEIDKRYDSIVQYSELEDYINVPLKYYSTGMISRLGFAISTALDPEILLIDEVFSVGDLTFRKKSEDTIRRLLESAHCQLIVTHNLGFVRDQCNRAIYINDGRIVADGDPAHVVSEYESWASSHVPGRAGSRFIVADSE